MQRFRSLIRAAFTLVAAPLFLTLLRQSAGALDTYNGVNLSIPSDAADYTGFIVQYPGSGAQ